MIMPKIRTYKNYINEYVSKNSMINGWTLELKNDYHLEINFGESKVIVYSFRYENGTIFKLVDLKRNKKYPLWKIFKAKCSSYKNLNEKDQDEMINSINWGLGFIFFCLENELKGDFSSLKNMDLNDKDSIL